MKYVHPNRVVEIVRRAYPDAGNISITQGCRDRWYDFDIDHQYGYPLREIGRLYDTGYVVVQLRVVVNGTVKYPDYRMEEFVEEFTWQVRDQLELNVNQGKRKAFVLAVLGDEALIEYEMPAGTTALWVINAHHPHPGCKRNVAYNSCPKKWLRAMEEAGSVWEGNSQ
jgi:hypothetical protein